VKFSIVTVVRNDAAHIEETMSSVLDGNADCEVEYIVIDGASTDGTAEIVARRANELAFFVSEPDSGIYDAMNKGISHATGDVVGIINSGDRYLPGAFKLVERALEGKCDEHHILWGDVEYERGGRVRGYRPEKRYIGAFAPHPSMFVPLAYYKKYGAYDVGFKLLGDYDFMYKAVNVVGVEPVYLPELLAFYRSGGVSDRRIFACLRDELRVKLRYGASPVLAYGMYFLKLLKNLPRQLLVK
jgi:glycosyltransferase